MIPLISTMPISEMFKYLAPFAERASSDARKGEYRDHGQADLSYETRLYFEIFMSQRDEIEGLKKRVAELENILKPE